MLLWFKIAKRLQMLVDYVVIINLLALFRDFRSCREVYCSNGMFLARWCSKTSKYFDLVLIGEIPIKGGQVCPIHLINISSPHEENRF